MMMRGRLGMKNRNVVFVYCAKYRLVQGAGRRYPNCGTRPRTEVNLRVATD